MLTTIYGRLSASLGDPADLDIYAHQIEPLRRLAAADGFHISSADVLCEVGTAEFIAARPTFARWLTTVETLPPNVGGVVYVTELARLSRGSMQERGRIMDALVKASIRIRTPSRWYDLANPDDELLFAFLSSVGRHEHGRAKERVQRKFDWFTREGMIPTGGDRYGYRWDKAVRQLIPQEPEFSVVKQLFVDAFHASTFALARRYGLGRVTVYNILRNPVYCGWPARHTRMFWRDGKPHIRYLPRREWIWPEKAGTYEAAVSRAEFERLQQVLAERATARAKTGADGWCREIVRFEGAEGKVSLSSQRWQQERSPTYKLIRSAGPTLYIERSLVHTAAAEAILAALSRPDILRRAWEAHLTLEAPEIASGEGAATIRQRLEKERRTLAELRLKWAEADPEDRTALDDAAAVVRGRIEGLKGRLQQAAARETGRRSQALLLELIEAWGDRLGERWPALPAARKQEIAGELLACVLVRVTPGPVHTVRATREVVRVEYAPWYQPFAAR